MSILVTGAAGFIGMHVCLRLLERGETVLGLDNLNDYYDVRLKQARLARLEGHPGFSFIRLDIADNDALANLFAQEKIDHVVHLAAQAGVRYSITDPHAYGHANLTGFLNILEACRRNEVRHLVYASSSSVYGGNRKMPFRESDPVDHPVSLYAATKKANELMAHSYSHLYGLPATGLRFFTVYGPYGRPDMSPILFARAIFEDRPIEIFNHGRMERDFTYIDDIVEGVVRVLDKPATPADGYDPMAPDPSISTAPWRVFNIGNNQPVNLLDYIGLMEQAAGKQAIRVLKPMQPGDVPATYADTDALNAWVGFAPSTPLAVGLERFIVWVRAYYGY
ncbi:MAG: NAD-dependent epimerase [Rhodospirillaceae bacterium]|nr:NAD-dependent epimerase [Rhodospirillaceae bacterium]